MKRASLALMLALAPAVGWAQLPPSPPIRSEPLPPPNMQGPPAQPGQGQPQQLQPPAGDTTGVTPPTGQGPAAPGQGGFNPPSGQPQPEQAQPEQLPYGQPRPEQAQPEQPPYGRPQPEQPPYGQPQPEQAQPEQPPYGQPQPEQMQPEQLPPGQPQPEQTQPEQLPPGQPQPEQPQQQPGRPAAPGHAPGVAAQRAPLTPAPPPPNEWIPQNGAIVQVLDKVNATSATLHVRVGESAAYGSLRIEVRACQIRPPNMRTDAAASLVIRDTNPDQPGFQGWMLENEPFLSMLQNPSYDVRIEGCTP